MKTFLEHYVVDSSISVAEAYWRLQHTKGLICIDESEKVTGFASAKEFDRIWDVDSDTLNKLSTADIYNTNFKYISQDSTNDIYAEARNIFADNPQINILPVLDGDCHLLDIMSRYSAFYIDFFNSNKLPRMNYASNIYYAASEAKRLNLCEISIIEFGVGTGNGLVACEFHANEIQRITGIEIKVYGFDSTGLLAPNDYTDIPYFFTTGNFAYDPDKIRRRLRFAQLITGDVSETLANFITDYNPPPIGCIFIDVDQYTPTKSILEWFALSDDKYFMPRVRMWFDDLKSRNHLTAPCHWFSEAAGQGLAIREFNKNYEGIMNITPESDTSQDFGIKMAHRLKHIDYCKYINGLKFGHMHTQYNF
jgi:hypothetical protein